MDDAVDVLLRPWRRRLPAFEPGDTVLFVGARFHPDLVDLVAPARLVVVQPFRPWADSLEGGDVEVRHGEDDVGEGHAAALVLLDKQAQVNTGRVGRAIRAVRPGGEILVCGGNRQGVKRYLELLDDLVGGVVSETKKRCRVGWTRVEDVDASAVAEAAAADAPMVADDGITTRPGVFSYEHPDPGTAALLRELPATIAGTVAIAGAGRGDLVRGALALCPDIETLHVLEADQRSLDALAANVDDPRVVVHHVDATMRWPVRHLDAVLTNPPFHVGGETNPDIGRAFLVQAHDALLPGRSMWMVANRHLPYERTLTAQFGQHWQVLREKGGFKVIRAQRRTDQRRS